jgi:hypothetical protein
MQDHRTAGEFLESRANPSPAIGSVHALGESHALRVDLEPAQVPWLADEVETLRAAVEDELARVRALHDQASASGGGASEIDDELERRMYQLRVLAMIREQLPVDAPVVAACVGDPWQPDDRALEAARITAPVTVVGPARGMLVLIRGAARNVSDALGEAMRGPVPANVAGATSYGYLVQWPEWGRLTPAVSARLCDIATAAQAFAGTYTSAVLQQAYSFDTDHYPVYPDELW